MFSTVSLAQQGLSETACHSGGRCDPIALVAVAAVVSTPNSTVWTILFVPQRSGKSEYGAPNFPVRALRYYHL